MDKNLELVQIPLAVHESDMEREDRKHKRNFILNIILIIYAFLMTVLFVVSNCMWIEYEKQFEDVVTTTTVTQEGDADGSGVVLLNNGGDLNYGEGETNDNNDNEDKN